jgi:3-oxo-5-alpha-steroid 4-dehydrogenase 1
MIFKLLTWIEFGVSLVIFVLLFFISAPYGRHNRKGFGAELNSRLAWFLMELPAPVIPGVFFVLSLIRFGFSWFTLAAMLIWETHYVYRTFIYSLSLRGSRRNFPFTLVAGAFSFNIMNGLINGNAAFLSNAAKGIPVIAENHIVGAIIFFTGFSITCSSDFIIRSLRKKGDTNYYIPRKGLFRFISNPNYFGEILEWTGWAIFTWSLAGLAFAIFTFANLFPRAVSNHKWYKKTFSDYPPERKVIIPFLF